MNPLKAVVLALALAAAQPVLADSSPDVQRARALLEAGKSDEAAAALEQAIARNQSDVEALVMLSELYAYSEMYDEALAQAQAAVAVARRIAPPSTRAAAPGCSRRTTRRPRPTSTPCWPKARTAPPSSIAVT